MKILKSLSLILCSATVISCGRSSSSSSSSDRTPPGDDRSASVIQERRFACASEGLPMEDAKIHLSLSADRHRVTLSTPEGEGVFTLSEVHPETLPSGFTEFHSSHSLVPLRLRVSNDLLKGASSGPIEINNNRIQCQTSN